MDDLSESELPTENLRLLIEDEEASSSRVAKKRPKRSLGELMFGQFGREVGGKARTSRPTKPPDPPIPMANWQNRSPKYKRDSGRIKVQINRMHLLSTMTMNGELQYVSPQCNPMFMTEAQQQHLMNTAGDQIMRAGAQLADLAGLSAGVIFNTITFCPDSGSDLTCVTYELALKIGATIVPWDDNMCQVQQANGEEVEMIGFIRAVLLLSGMSYPTVFFIPRMRPGTILPYDVLLGNDTMAMIGKFTIDYIRRHVILQDEQNKCRFVGRLQRDRNDIIVKPKREVQLDMIDMLDLTGRVVTAMPTQNQSLIGQRVAFEEPAEEDDQLDPVPSTSAEPPSESSSRGRSDRGKKTMPVDSRAGRSQTREKRNPNDKSSRSAHSTTSGYQSEAQSESRRELRLRGQGRRPNYQEVNSSSDDEWERPPLHIYDPRSQSKGRKSRTDRSRRQSRSRSATPNRYSDRERSQSRDSRERSVPASAPSAVNDSFTRTVSKEIAKGITDRLALTKPRKYRRDFPSQGPLREYPPHKEMIRQAEEERRRDGETRSSTPEPLPRSARTNRRTNQSDTPASTKRRMTNKPTPQRRPQLSPSNGQAGGETSAEHARAMRRERILAKNKRQMQQVSEGVPFDNESEEEGNTFIPIGGNGSQSPDLRADEGTTRPTDTPVEAVVRAVKAAFKDYDYDPYDDKYELFSDEESMERALRGRYDTDDTDDFAMGRLNEKILGTCGCDSVCDQGRRTKNY